MNRRCQGDEGSIHPLMLAVVFVIALAAVLIRDIGTAGLTRWQAMQAAQDAADAAVQALDEPYYLTTGEPRLDPNRARELAAASLDGPEEVMSDFAVEGRRARVAVVRRPRTILIPDQPIEEDATSTLELGVTAPEP